MLKKITISFLMTILCLTVFPTNVFANEVADSETIFVTVDELIERAEYNEYGMLQVELQENEELILPRMTRGVVFIIGILTGMVVGWIVDGVLIAETGQGGAQWVADMYNYQPDWNRVRKWYVTNYVVDHYINEYGAQCTKKYGSEVCSFSIGY